MSDAFTFLRPDSIAFACALSYNPSEARTLGFLIKSLLALRILIKSIVISNKLEGNSDFLPPFAKTISFSIDNC
jgi:hypothetical protein